MKGEFIQRLWDGCNMLITVEDCYNRQISNLYLTIYYRSYIIITCIMAILDYITKMLSFIYLFTEYSFREYFLSNFQSDLQFHQS